MKLTAIYPHTMLPVRSGVYQTQNVDPEDLLTIGGWGFSYFDATDRIWGCTYTTPSDAFRAPDYEFAYQTKQWRGLSDPQS